MFSWANLLNPPLGGLSIQSVLQLSAQITPHSLLTSYNIELNQQTTLNIIYEYGAGTYMEYPEMKENGCISHLFTVLDLEQWPNPATYFAYSLGPPKVPTRLDIATFCLIMTGCGSLVVYHTSLVCSYFGILLFHWTYNIQRPGGVEFVHTLISRKLKHHTALPPVKASETNLNSRSIHSKINRHHQLKYSRRCLHYGQHFAKLGVVAL